MVPDGVERSRKGAIYLAVGEPTVITDGEAEYIRQQQADERTGLHRFRIILEALAPPPVAEEVVEHPVTVTNSMSESAATEPTELPSLVEAAVEEAAPAEPVQAEVRAEVPVEPEAPPEPKRGGRRRKG